MKEPKLLKLVMEFEDKIQTLEGKDAQTWLEAANSAITMDFVHGQRFPKFKWKTSTK